MVNQPYITISNAKLGYHKRAEQIEVVNIEHLDLNSGEVIGLAGMNGTGKSTLLRSACGLIPLLQGSLQIKGKAFSSFSPSELAKHIAIVLTERLGGFNLKVKDVVGAGRMPYTGAFHHLEKLDEEKILLAMRRCGINDQADKELTELSDGTFQKTMIAKAIAQETGVLLLDEPTAYLDYASKHHLFKLLCDLSKQDQKCVVASSHDLDLLLKYCDRLVVISDGKIETMPIAEARNNLNFQKIAGGFL